MAKAHSLESILETLSLQLVPPSLHHVASSSSLFGSQHSDEQRDSKVYDAPSTGFLQSAQEIRKLKDSATLNDRTRWKSLRDFVDERGIDEAAEAMDVDRTALDVSSIAKLWRLANFDLTESACEYRFVSRSHL